MATRRADVVAKSLQGLFDGGAAAGMPDGELLARFVARRDDSAEQAFGVLVARHGSMVLAACRGLLGDDHSAEDAFQATFLVLARKAGTIREPNLLGPWLYGVALRTARKARGRAAGLEAKRGGPVSEPVDDLRPEQATIRREEVALLHEELGRLPESYRRPILLCDLEGLSHAEAGHRLHLSANTVSARLSRGRRRLRSRLVRRGLAPSAALITAQATSATVPAALEATTVRASAAFATGHVTRGSIPATVTALAEAMVRASSFSVRKAIAAGAALLLLPAGAAVVLAGGEAPGRAEAPRAVEKTSDIPKEPAPSFPGAVTRAPDWISPQAPFDVAKYFELPPPEENAAPLYLDALFEFSNELAICFPEGPARKARSQALEERGKRFGELLVASSNDPKAVTATMIDETIAPYVEGFRKLVEAQRRPRCVFATGLGLTTQLPHAQGARHVGRVATYRIRRDLERGEIDAAIRDVEITLRLARDLRPRGGAIMQLVAASLDTTIVKDGLLSILASPRIRLEHADRLLAIFRENLRESIDGYAEGMREEYLLHVKVIRDLIYDQPTLARDLKEFNSLNPNGSVVLSVVEPRLISVLSTKTAPAAPPRPAPPRPVWPEDIDAQVAKTTPEELARLVARLDEYYRRLLTLRSFPYLTRLEKAPDRTLALGGDDLLSRVVVGTNSGLMIFVRAQGIDTARLRAAECLIALKRQRLTHPDAPPDLAAAVRDAGLKAIPVDPFDGSPMRLAVIDDEPVIYSVGRDGRDDGGLVDSRNDSSPGDLTFRFSTEASPK